MEPTDSRHSTGGQSTGSRYSTGGQSTCSKHSKHSTGGNGGKKSMDFKQIGTFVMTFTCIMTPLSVIYHNPRYFFASEAFADGGDLYSHFTEAHYIKETLQNGGSNFWFSRAALGYPLITAYQPLPGFFIAVCMICFERFISPLLIFRLIFVTVLAFIPVAMHKSAQIFGLKQTEQIVLCLLSFAIQSWRRFGLEIPAFVDYGLLTQAFGMLILFPAVSILYRWILMKDCKPEDSTLPILILSVSFLTNFFFGVLTCILAVTMLIVNVVGPRRGTAVSALDRIQNFSLMLVKTLMLISWWILSCIAGYSYIGGLPWRGESEDGYKLTFIAESFSDGEMFDSSRYIPWFTILVLLGITINCLNTAPSIFYSSSCSSAERARSLWLLLSTVISFLLFLGRTSFSFLYDLIPLHTELETVKYLSALHFCGLLFASRALSETISKLSEVGNSIINRIDDAIETGKIAASSELLQAVQFLWRKFRKLFERNILTLVEEKENAVKAILVLVASGLLWTNHFQVVGTHLTMTEVNHDFIEQLKRLRNDTGEGRLLGNRDLRLLTYSRGYHDSLSLFYLESLRFNPEKTPLFVNTLRLYNVHFLVTADIRLDDYFTTACQLKYLTKIDDLVFYEVLHEENDYGYFDFIRIPGYIRGDLKLIRQAALKALELYKVNSLLMINPTDDAEIMDNVVVDVRRVPLWKDWRGFAQKKAQSTWSLNVTLYAQKFVGKEADSKEIIDKVIKADAWKWVYSQVVEEEVVGNDYRAIVDVSDRGSDPSLVEHLLLKVTYHPFWKCYYYRVSDDFVLNMFNDSQLFDGKMYAHINHVIPNLMSISLPPGRYLLIFTYRFPGLFKILTLFCALGYLRLLLKCLSEHNAERSSKNLSEHKVVRSSSKILSEHRVEKSASKVLSELRADRSSSKSLSEHKVETFSPKVMSEHNVQRSLSNIEKPTIIPPEVPRGRNEDFEEPREAVLRKVRTEEETLPNFRLRKAASQATNMRDWQVLVRATLQRRRIVNELERVFATKDKSRSSGGSEPKGGSNEADKHAENRKKSVASKPAASMPSRPHKDQTARAQASSGSGSSRSRHNSSTSSISEASASDEDRSSERSDNRAKGLVKKVAASDRNGVHEHLEIEGFIGREGSSDRNPMSQENNNYLLDVNANFTSKRGGNGSSNRSKVPPGHDTRSSDSSGGEDTHVNTHGRNQRSSISKDNDEERRKLTHLTSLFRN